MKKKIKVLIMGLPGSGKTTLGDKLAPLLKANRVNADEVRKKFNDWDFTLDGRLRQANRMKKIADESTKQWVILDFICPLVSYRNIINFVKFKNLAIDPHRCIRGLK